MDVSVCDLMTDVCVTLPETANLWDLSKVMEAKHVRHVPILNRDGKLVGLVSHREVLRHSLSEWPKIRATKRKEWLQSQSVCVVMKEDRFGAIKLITPEDGLHLAANRMKEAGVGCLPVVSKEERLVGLLSEGDFVRLFAGEKHLQSERGRKTEREIQLQDLRVEDLMTPECKTALCTDSLKDVAELMGRFHVRHVPILSSVGELVGLITHRDLLRFAMAEGEFTDQQTQEMLLESIIQAEEIMRSPVKTASASERLKDSAEKMCREHLGCLPVVEGKKVIGILTEGDFLRFFGEPL